MRLFPCFLLLVFLASCAPKITPPPSAPVAPKPAGAEAAPAASIETKTKGMTAYTGYFNFWYDEKEGKIWLEIKNFDEEFLYVNSLPAGIGSNDIGLDRGQIGGTRIVKFIRSGPKILLVQPNYSYRAVSDNPAERRSAEEAFAQSVLWGFTAVAQSADRYLVDFTPFMLNDMHDVAGALARTNQGVFKVDPSRSAPYLARTKSFPDNSEWETTLTFTGEAKGEWIRSVTPTPGSVTVRTHHSFIKLPDAGFQPRPFDPRSGFFEVTFADYAQPVGHELVRKYTVRHRLQKKDPSAAVSDPVEPIVYYMDPGCPEPVRSALMEGASWWNQAFEAAGYRNAFQVKVLPDDADPMDVRYNLIQWVHRSTRGWSYGSTVSDPRTGEIIKGQVTLGSLRVRQDYLIAQGILSDFVDGKPVDSTALRMALARLRQLAAHEVGHTLGLAHNFAASVNNRASVMDYPHPYITLKADGSPDFSDAYDTGIGEWDKRAILFGYQDFPAGVNQAAALQKIIADTDAAGLLYISDDGARAPSTGHPQAHLWDNGADAVAELKRISTVRRNALARFGLNSIPQGDILADLEHVLVPLYLAHRYQVEAVSKIVGGASYGYSVKDGRPNGQLAVPVPPDRQRAALDALLETLQPSYLALPEQIIRLIPPQPVGFDRDREMFPTRTGGYFDPLSAAETGAQLTLNTLLQPDRLQRIVEQAARDPKQADLSATMQVVCNEVFSKLPANATSMEQEISRSVQKLLLRRLLELAGSDQATPAVQAVMLDEIIQLKTAFNAELARTIAPGSPRAHLTWLLRQIELFADNPGAFKLPPAPVIPPGQPIGCE